MAVRKSGELVDLVSGGNDREWKARQRTSSGGRDRRAETKEERAKAQKKTGNISSGKNRSSAGRSGGSASGRGRSAGKGRARRASRQPSWMRFLHLAVFPVLLLYDELMLRILTPAKFRGFFYPFFFSIAVGLMLSGLTCAFSKKVNRIISIAVMAVTAVYFTAQSMLFDTFKIFFTLGDIGAAGGDVANGFGDMAVHAILTGIPKIILFCGPVVLYIIFGKKYLPARRFHVRFVALLVVAGLVLNALFGIFAGHGKFRADYKSEYTYDKAVRTFGMVTGTRLSVKYSLFGNKAAASGFDVKKSEKTSPTPAPTEGPAVTQHPDATPTPTPITGYNEMDIDFEDLAENADDETVRDIASYVSSLDPSNKNEYTGLFAGKNLILICAEAFSDAVIDPELTPTLYRMTHNGFYFSDYYQPAWGGSTSTGEFSMLFGLAPQSGVETMLQTIGNNNYFTMGNQLQRQDYYNAAYHNGTYDYYDRNQTHENLGYESFLAYGQNLDDITGLWVDDGPCFERTLENYIDKQPFSVYYMSISGHAPYKEEHSRVSRNYDYVDSIVGDKYAEKTKYYLCYQVELEFALETMIEMLEDAGIADDTVICMTADHYPYGLAKSDNWGNDENYIADLYQEDYEGDWGRDRNSLIIWSGCLEHEHKDMACEIDTPTYSLDILPTLSNLFGLEYDSRLMVGRDVFSDQDPLVFWNNKSWVTERGKYDGDDDEFYPNDGYEEDEDYIDEINSIVKNKRTFSKSVLSTDFYGVLFGEDDEVGRAIYDSDGNVIETAAPAAAASPEEPESEPESEEEEETEEDSEEEEESEEDSEEDADPEDEEEESE